MSDTVNKPTHYNQGSIECIEAMQQILTPEEFRGFLKGNVFKYLWREKDKNGNEDLKKAKWYLDRLVEHCDLRESLLDISNGLVKAWACENGKAKQVYPEPKWTPKVRDWVRIRKPSGDKRDSVLWSSFMDEHDKEVVQVKEIKDGAMVHGEWFFPFDWLEPAEQPKPTLNSDKIPDGYRKLKDSSIEPRQRGDLRWSIAEKRYIEIGFDEIGYANRDNWAACRKVEPVVKQSLTTEPPDGWRWLEVGEVIRKGDRFWYEGAWHDRHEDLIGWKYSVNHCQSIRRNRFEVGEKVVHGFGDRQSISVVENILGDGWVDLVRDGVSTAYHVKDLAPYIEDAK